MGDDARTEGQQHGDEVVPWAEPVVPDRLAGLMTSGWAPAPVPDHGADAVAPFARRRRQQVTDVLGTRVLAVCSGTPPRRNGDQFHRHRCSSEFLHLCGAALEDAVLVMDGRTETLFMRVPTRAGEAQHWLDRRWGGLWEGARPGLDEMSARLEIPTRPLDELDGVLAGAGDRLVVVGGTAPAGTVLEGREADTGWSALLEEHRMVKDAFELAELRAAVAVTVHGFTELAREVGPGVSERWLEGCFSRRARTSSEAMGYHPIVAAGANACVLHWWRNDGACCDGEVLLVDAGAELVSGYTADVTRVLPVSGRFSETQAMVVAAVEQARAAAVAKVAPGVTIDDVHRCAMEVLSCHLVDWGLLSSVDEAMSHGLHRRWTLHGTSHFLGLDVHDCAAVDPRVYRGPLGAGMVLTVEPGLYFQPDDELVPAELRGTGVRLEDDVAVTVTGRELMSAALPSAPGEVEAWMAAVRASRPSQGA